MPASTGSRTTVTLRASSDTGKSQRETRERGTTRRQPRELAARLRRRLATCEELIRRRQCALAEQRFVAELLCSPAAAGDNAELGYRRSGRKTGDPCCLRFMNDGSWRHELAPFSGAGNGAFVHKRVNGLLLQFFRKVETCRSKRLEAG
jgi:hypothetical protein